MPLVSLKKLLATESNIFTLDALPTLYARKKFHMVESCKIIACFWIRSQGWPPLQTGLVTQSYPWFYGRVVVEDTILKWLFFQVIKCLNRLEEMAIYDKVADLKNTFPRLVVQYMKKYYKFCNISFCRRQNTVYIFKLNHCVQMLIIAKAVLNFNPCSCFFNFKSSVLSKTDILWASNCEPKT